MLKNLGYDGAYRDETITVNVLLENPLEHSLDESMLVFGVTMRNKIDSTHHLQWAELIFYVMEENDCLHNTENMQSLHPDAATESACDKPIPPPDRLIRTAFRPEFLFQDLRVAFYNRRTERLHIIKLQR
jgi:hypothetical protein